MDFVIMAAGRGERLKPYTNYLPKPMTKIYGKPIIDWILDSIKYLPFSNIFIITGYKENILKRYLKNKDVICIHQSNIIGTANAISSVEDKINKEFIVLPGDMIFNKEDLLHLYKFNNSLLYGKTCNVKDYGVLKIKDNKILNIEEKPFKTKSHFINLSAYHFDKKIFKYIKSTPIVNKEQRITDSINLYIKDNEVNCIFVKKWCHVTYKEDLNREEDKWILDLERN